MANVTPCFRSGACGRVFQGSLCHLDALSEVTRSSGRTVHAAYKRKGTSPVHKRSLSPHLLPWEHELAFTAWGLLGNRRFRNARDFDLIQTIMHFGCGNQVAHRGLQGLVPHPVLNSPYVETLTQHPGRVGGSKCLQIERRRIETSSFGDRFAKTQHILLAIAGRGRKHEDASIRLRMPFEDIGQAYRHWYLSLFPALREKIEVWLGTHADRPQAQVHIGPTQRHHLLLTEAGEQECGEDGDFRVIAGGQKLGQFFLSVFAGERRDSFGQMHLPGDS